MAPYRVGQVVALLAHASMSTTYRPALLKALVRFNRLHRSTEISLQQLGGEFLKMYWNQTVVYHLRQAAVISKESEVVRRLREAALSQRARLLSDLPEAGRSKLESSMAEVLSIDVLRRFHRSAPAEMPKLYHWSQGDPIVRLRGDAVRFLHDHGATLEVIANYYWAKYLEKCNWLAPAIIQKVSRDGAARSSLKKYLNILMESDGGKCFYCGAPFSSTNPPTVDHFIPWTFLLADPIWDLVAACSQCNGSKSDWLPERRYLESITRRNAGLARAASRNKVSPLISGELVKLYDAAVSVEWPGFWEPRF